MLSYRVAKIIHHKTSSLNSGGGLSSMLSSKERDQVCLVGLLQSDAFELHVCICRPYRSDNFCRFGNLTGSQRAERMLRRSLLPSNKWEGADDLFCRHCVMKGG